MKECQRCGECCKWIVHKMMGLSPEVIDWLLKRGIGVDGDYIKIPHICQHLVEEDIIVEERGVKVKKRVATCDIHYKDEYPIICRRFHGHGRYFIPEGCVYSTPEAENEQKQLVIDAKSKFESKQHKNKQSKKGT